MRKWNWMVLLGIFAVFAPGCDSGPDEPHDDADDSETYDEREDLASCFISTWQRQ